MQLIEANVPMNWDLWDIGDFHVGSTAFHEKGLLKVIDEIASTPKARVVLGGDLIEAIAVDDPRYSAENVDPHYGTPIAQAHRVVELLAPIAKKIVCVLDGNHEMKLRNKAGFITRDVICRGLGITHLYATYTAKFTYKDKHGQQFKHFTTHGYRKIGSMAKDVIQEKANIKAACKKIMSPMAGDTLLMTRHHNHKLYIVEPDHQLYLTDDGSKISQHYHTNDPDQVFIHPDHRTYGGSGAFYKTYGEVGTDNYAERAEYAPVELGCLKFEIRDRQLVKSAKVVV